MTAEEFVTVKKRLAEIPYCISMKRTHKNKPPVPYIKHPGGTWQCVPMEDREKVSKEFDEKQVLQDRYQQMLAELKAMSRAERKDFLQRVKLYTIISSMDLTLQASQMADGSCRASKSEVIANDIIDRLGLSYEYEPPIRINGSPYKPDFLIGDVFWEHMGKVTDPDYMRRYDTKLLNYDLANLEYIVTKDHAAKDGQNTFIKVPEILWILVCAGVVSAEKVLKTYYPDY